MSSSSVSISGSEVDETETVETSKNALLVGDISTKGFFRGSKILILRKIPIEIISTR